MRKISIIGAGGSGKTYLAEKLGEKLGIKVYSLNKIRHNPQKPMSREEFEQFQRHIIETCDEFIFDGNYKSTLDLRLNNSDTIIFLDFSPGFNLGRSVKKNITVKTSDDPKIKSDHTAKLNVGYIRWLANYDKEERVEILKKLNELKLEKRIIIIDNENKRELFLESVDKDSNR